MGVRFYFLSSIELKQRKNLKLFIKSIFLNEGKTLNALSYIFCDDAYLLNINKTYLKHNYFTDIVTFDLSKDSQQPTEGEVYISVDRVKENASTFHVKVETELHRVMFHGALHLCGFKDKTPVHKKLMTSKENFYISDFNTMFHVEHSPSK